MRWQEVAGGDVKTLLDMQMRWHEVSRHVHERHAGHARERHERHAHERHERHAHERHERHAHERHAHVVSRHVHERHERYALERHERHTRERHEDERHERHAHERHARERHTQEVVSRHAQVKTQEKSLVSVKIRSCHDTHRSRCPQTTRSKSKRRRSESSRLVRPHEFKTLREFYGNQGVFWVFWIISINPTFKMGLSQQLLQCMKHYNANGFQMESKRILSLSKTPGHTKARSLFHHEYHPPSFQ